MLQQLNGHLITARSRDKNIHLRQSVTLSGLRAKMFDEAIEAVFTIHAIFSRHFPEHSMEEWKPSSFMDHQTIMIANRYFSEKRFCPCATPVQFHPSVDPKGILANMVGDKLVHTQENHVDYYKQLSSNHQQQT